MTLLVGQRGTGWTHIAQGQGSGGSAMCYRSGYLATPGTAATAYLHIFEEVTASTAKVCIYDAGGNLVGQSGAIDVTSPGLKSAALTSSVELTAQTYKLVVTLNSGYAYFAANSGSNNFQDDNWNSAAFSYASPPPALPTPTYEEINREFVVWLDGSAGSGGGLDAPVGRADETDAGLALTKRKTRGPATATEADTALAATKRKVRAVGLGAESDSAIDLSRRKARGALLGAEGDSAQAAGRRKARSTSAAAEIDSALGLSRRKSRSATLAAEGDAALSLTRRKTRAIGPAAETDAALELGPASGITVGTANETDSALALTRRKAKSATSAIETDTAQAPTRRKMRVAAQANEIDTALGPARRKTRTTAQAAETDAAQALTRRKTRTAAVAVESDTASARARLKRRAAGRADETDTAIARSPPGLIALPVGAATETDAALALARAQPGAAASQASRVSKARIRPAAQWLGPAPFVPAPQRVRVQMATEKSMAFALTRTPPDYSRHIALLLLSAA